MNAVAVPVCGVWFAAANVTLTGEDLARTAIGAPDAPQAPFVWLDFACKLLRTNDG
jgi:hypothetical protein